MAGAIAVTTALVVAGFLVFAEVDRASARGEETFVVAETQGGGLLLSFKAVALGSFESSGDDESIDWHRLAPSSGRLDLRSGRWALASGVVGADELKVARLTFASASLIVGDEYDHLAMPQDTLQLVVPGEPGRPGDTLLLTFDTQASVMDDDGFLSFRPFVAHAVWLRGDAPAPTGPTATASPDLLAYDSSDHATNGTSGGTGAGGTGGTGGGAGGGSGGGSGGGCTTACGGGKSGNVGKVRVYVRDLEMQTVSSLNVTFQRVSLGPPAGQTGDVTTYFDGARTIDIRKYAGPADRALLTEFQAPIGDYGSLHFAFSAASGQIDGKETQMVVPQPTLVLERGFSVSPSGVLELLVDFSVPESLAFGAQGVEFRPVVSQFQASDADADGDGTLDPADPDDDNDGTPDASDTDRDGDGVPDAKPSQYRTGGSALPSLGQSTDATVQETSEETGVDVGVGGEDDESRPILSDDSIADVDEALDDVGVPGPLG